MSIFEKTIKIIKINETILGKFLTKICLYFKENYKILQEYLIISEFQMTAKIYETIIVEFYKIQDMRSIEMIIKHHMKRTPKHIFDLDLPSSVYKSIINYLINPCNQDELDIKINLEDESCSLNLTPSYCLIECESKELALDEYEIC